jgi:peroxiredoxin/uncharacterized membrane protein YphA (DoxX/SURF4 family)
MDSYKRKYFGDKIHIVISILRILFGILFIFSAATKFLDISAFESSIKKFALVPDYFAGSISYIVPSVEIILGIFLILKIKLEIILQLVIYLLVFFTSVISVSLVEGRDISCGCFGVLSSNNIELTTVIRNILLIVWGLVILFYTMKLKYSSMADLKFKSNIKNFFIIGILFFLLVQNSAFAIRNIELKNRVYWLMDNDMLSEDEKVKDLKVYDLEGMEQKIKFNQSSYTILFFMQYGCHLCKENVILWNQLNETFQKDKNVQVVGISIDGINVTKRLFTEYFPKFKLVFNASEDFRNDLKLFRTPLTLIINKNNSINKIYKGKLNNVLLQRITEEVHNN